MAIHRVLQHANNPMVATDKWADEMIKEAVEKLGKCPGIITGALPFRYRNERKPK